MSHFMAMLDLGPIELSDDGVHACAEALLAPYNEALDIVAPYRVRLARAELTHRLTDLIKEGKSGGIALPEEPSWGRFELGSPEQRDALDSWDATIVGAFKDVTDEDLAQLLTSQYEDRSGAVKVDPFGLYEISAFNPNGKWDWWQLGGRWLGRFKLKDSAAPSVTGKSGVSDNEKIHVGGVDAAKQGDIDWEGMFEESRDDAGERWDVLTRAEATESGGWPPEPLGTREEYIARYGLPESYAFVNEDGEWFQKGQSGWFGAPREETTEDEWSLAWARFVESVPPDHVLAVVDCHV